MPRPPNSWVWNYFKYVDSEDGVHLVECSICSICIRYSPRNGPTNLSRHMVRQHNLSASASTRRPFPNNESKSKKKKNLKLPWKAHG